MNEQFTIVVEMHDDTNLPWRLGDWRPTYQRSLYVKLLYSTILIHRFAFAFAQDRSKRKFPNEKSYIGLLHRPHTMKPSCLCCVAL